MSAERPPVTLLRSTFTQVLAAILVAAAIIAVAFRMSDRYSKWSHQKDLMFTELEGVVHVVLAERADVSDHQLRTRAHPGGGAPDGRDPGRQAIFFADAERTEVARNVRQPSNWKAAMRCLISRAAAG